MWPICNLGASSFLWLLLPLILGLLTGWWIWANRRTDAAYTPPVPVAKPVRVADAVAAPVAEPVVAPVAKPIATPVIAAVAAAGALTAIGIPAAVGAADDLLLIKGVGPKLNGLLNSLGITRFDQIAAWGRDDVAKVDTHLENFSGRIEREEWIPQAKLLATGNMTEFNRLYGSDVASVAVAAAAGAIALTAIGIPAAVGAADDLLQLKGVGPKLNILLNSLGVTRFDQIAAWTASDVAKVDPELGSFKGRIERESWVEQAGLLATGAIAAFEAKFGKLDSENK